MFGGPGGPHFNLGGNVGMGGDSTGQSRITLAASEDDFGKAFDSRIMQRMWRYMAPYKLRVFISVFLLLVYDATYVLYPLIPGLAINAIAHHDVHSFILACVFFVINNVVMWLSQYQYQYQMTWVGQHALYLISSAMFRRIVRLSMDFFDANETGRIMARLRAT